MLSLLYNPTMAEKDRYIFVVKLGKPVALDSRQFTASSDPTVQRRYSSRLFPLSLDGTPEERELRRLIEDRATMLIGLGIGQGRTRRLEQNEKGVEIVKPGENGISDGVYIDGALTLRNDYQVALRADPQTGIRLLLSSSTYAAGYRDDNGIFHATYGFCSRDQGSGDPSDLLIPQIPEATPA